jgi:hypothetical protein
MSRKGQSRSSWVPVVSFNRAVHSRQQTDPGLRARTGMPIISSGLAKPASFTTAGLPLMAFPCRWTTTTSKMESRSSWYCCRAPQHPWTAPRDFPHPASRCACRVLPREGLDDRREVWRIGGRGEFTGQGGRSRPDGKRSAIRLLEDAGRATSGNDAAPGTAQGHRLHTGSAERAPMPAAMSGNKNR